MAAIKNMPLSITDIEKQIAKVSAELAKARAKEFATAEKSFQSAQKATDAARARFDKLQAKSGSNSDDPRLQKAREELDHHEALLAEASNAYELVKVQQDAANELAATIASLNDGDAKMAKKNKADKDSKKGDKKAHKKQLKQEAKAEKKAAKEEAKAAKDAKKMAKKAGKKMKVDKASAAENPIADAAQPEAEKVIKKSPARKKPAPKSAPVEASHSAEVDEPKLEEKVPVEEPDATNNPAITPETEMPAETGVETLAIADDRDSEETPTEHNDQHSPKNDYSVE